MRKRIKGAIIILSLTLLAGCGKKVQQESPAEAAVIMEEGPEEERTANEGIQEEEAAKEPVFEEYELQLMAVGDNLLHMGIVATGEQEDGSYNYDCLFKGIEEYLALSHIKVINQETILGGNHLGFSGYPLFNSPTEVGEAIKKAGFNVVLHATNHAADKGIEGLVNCVDFWEKQEGILMAGIDKDSGFEAEIPILEVEGIKVAILNYTYSPNTEVLPKSIQGHLNMLCHWDLESGRIDFTKLHSQVTEEIKRAEQEADFTIVFPHWGTEYATLPSEYQRIFARQMTEAGADLIIGTHPHVLQPVEWVEGEQGSRALCYYSLGNYVSTQKDPLNMLEGMAWVRLLVQEEGVCIKEEGTGILPLVCQYVGGSPRLDQVYPLDQYSEELAEKHGIVSYGGRAIHLEDLAKWSEEILGEWALTSEEILTK